MFDGFWDNISRYPRYFITIILGCYWIRSHHWRRCFSTQPPRSRLWHRVDRLHHFYPPCHAWQVRSRARVLPPLEFCGQTELHRLPPSRWKRWILAIGRGGLVMATSRRVSRVSELIKREVSQMLTRHQGWPRGCRNGKCNRCGCFRRSTTRQNLCQYLWHRGSQGRDNGGLKVGNEFRPQWTGAAGSPAPDTRSCVCRDRSIEQGFCRCSTSWTMLALMIWQRKMRFLSRGRKLHTNNLDVHSLSPDLDTLP